MGHLPSFGPRPLVTRKQNRPQGSIPRGLSGTTVPSTSPTKTATGPNAPVAVQDGQILSTQTVTAPQARSMQFSPGSMQFRFTERASFRGMPRQKSNRFTSSCLLVLDYASFFQDDTSVPCFGWHVKLASRCERLLFGALDRRAGCDSQVVPTKRTRGQTKPWRH